MEGGEQFNREVERLMNDSEDFRSRVQTMRDQRVPPPNTVPARTGTVRDLEVFTPTNPIQRNR